MGEAIMMQIAEYMSMVTDIIILKLLMVYHVMLPMPRLPINSKLQWIHSWDATLNNG